MRSRSLSCHRRAVGAAQQGAHAGDELARAERLHHVVVAADGEADLEIRLAVARGEHEDGHAPVALDLAAHAEPVEAGQHQVEHDEVGAEAAAEIDALVAVAGRLDLESLGRQPGRDRGGDARLVLDHRDTLPAHALSLGASLADRVGETWRFRAGRSLG